MKLSQNNSDEIILLSKANLTADDLFMEAHQEPASHIEENRISEAIETLKEITYKKQSNFYTYYLLGICRWLNGDKRKSLNHFKTSLRMLRKSLNISNFYRQKHNEKHMSTDFDIEKYIEKHKLTESVILECIKKITSPSLLENSYQRSIRGKTKLKTRMLKSAELNRDTFSKLIRCEIELNAYDPEVVSSKTFSVEVTVLLASLGAVICCVSPALFWGFYLKTYFPLHQIFMSSILALFFISFPILPVYIFDTDPISEKYIKKRFFDVSPLARLNKVFQKGIYIAWFSMSAILYVEISLKALMNHIQVNVISFAFLSGVPVFPLIITLFFLAYFSVELITFPIYLILKFRRYHHLTDKLIASRLADILIISNFDDWFKLATKSKLIESLYQTSFLFKYKLPKAFSVRDDVRSKYIKDAFFGVGSYLENLSIWVVTPKKDTKAFFSAEIVKILDAFLQHDWDYFTHLQADTPQNKNNFASNLERRISNITFQALASAILPPLVILLVSNHLKQYGFSYEILLLGAFYWSFVRLLKIIDPEFDETIKTAQAALQAFPNHFK